MRPRSPRAERSHVGRGILFGLLLLVIGTAGHASLQEGVSDVELLSDGVRFVLSAPVGEPRLAVVPGEPNAIGWEGFASCMTPEGWQLPARTVWIAIPPVGDFELTYETLGSRSLVVGGALPATATPRGPSVRAGSAQWMRDQRVVPVTWSPIVLGPDGPMAEDAVRVMLRSSGGRGAAGVRSTDPGWERIYSDLLINYDQARGWRRDVRPSAARRGVVSVLTADPRIRIETAHTGLYAITGADLQASGFDLAEIRPDSLRLFTGSGVSLPENTSVFDLPSELNEVSVRLEGTEDGSFDPQDRILFHAVGPDAWYSDLGLHDSLHERYRVDEFSNVNTYWLSWAPAAGTPRRWGAVDGTGVTETPETSALERIHYEKNLLWDPRPRTVTAFQPPYPDTLPAWEKWHWLELIASRSNVHYQLPFVLPDPVAGADADLWVRMWGASYVFTGALPDHWIRLDLSGNPVGQRLWDDLGHVDVKLSGIRFDGENQTLGLHVPFRGDSSAITTDRQYLGWFEIDYRRNLIARGDSVEFWIEPGLAARAFAIDGLTSSGSPFILDVTDPQRTVAVTPRFEVSGATRRAVWQTDGDPDRLRHIRVVSGTAPAKPRIVVYAIPERGLLRERTDAVDYILITNRDFLEAANSLADWRATHGPGGEGLRTAVVDVQEIYDEFSAGRLDPTAVRNFLCWAYEQWNGGDPTHRPTYVVFFGDTSYDFRNRLQQGAAVWVPSYEGYYDPILRHSIYQPQFATDDWFVLFDPPPDGSLDMSPGRLPADSPTAAAAMVLKIIEYESQQAPGAWRQSFTLVADDICQGLSNDALGFTHMRQTEALADSLPVELRRDRVYLYEFGTECLYDRKPDAAAALRQRIDDGTLVVNYTGHGSEGQLADERVLETSSVASMTNRDRLFFFLTASCSVGKFNFAGTGLGEALVRQPRGGAIGVFSATAVAFSGANAELNRAFFRSVWPRKNVLRDIPIGDAAVIAKASVGNPSGLNNRRYPLLGEPVVSLGTPGLRCAMTIEGVRGGVARPDTLFRGGAATLSGEIVDGDGVLRSDYAGNVNIEIYDSEVLRHAEGSAGQGSIDYNLAGSPIYRGSVSVNAGRFELSFTAPSALRTGSRGLASAYAFAENANGLGAIGALAKIVVPEITPETSSDQQGPTITLRPLTATDMQAIPPESKWFATMEDSSGINITQLVPSRSVVMRIEEGSRIVHLEDLAASVSFPSRPSEASLEFALPSNLESGVPYRLTIEASDNRDHRSARSVDFTIAGAGATGLDFARVYNVPNPTDGPTTFFLEINRPARVEIDVFTSSGRPIRKIRPEVALQPAEAGTEGLFWDGLDDDGDPLGNGIYFYKVTVSDDEGGRKSRIEKLAVVR